MFGRISLRLVYLRYGELNTCNERACPLVLVLMQVMILILVLVLATETCRIVSDLGKVPIYSLFVGFRSTLNSQLYRKESEVRI